MAAPGLDRSLGCGALRFGKSGPALAADISHRLCPTSSVMPHLFRATIVLRVGDRRTALSKIERNRAAGEARVAAAIR